MRFMEVNKRSRKEWFWTMVMEELVNGYQSIHLL